MITVEFEDVYSPVGPCGNCGKDLLLEPCGELRREYEAKCWACGNSRTVDLDFQEKYVKRLYPQVQSWRILRPSREFPDGLLIFGDNLFTTTEKKRAITEKLLSLKVPQSGQMKIEAALQEIEDREEAIDSYFRAHQIENAYHFAAVHHKCGIIDGYSPLHCKEMVNWISADPNGLFVEHFNIYGLVVKAWKSCCEKIRSGKTDAQNETEIRYLFVEIFRSLDANPFEIWFQMERKIYVHDQTLQPDAQIPALLVIEIKSFFAEQEYNCSQAISLVADDLHKLEKYKDSFKVGFFLCFTQKFSKNRLMRKIPRSFSYPVRVVVEEG
ncbi:MAG: hypothetical protein PF482_13015 [Desulfobacteraceae bacterium]|nr:hypothetical protein [Desulfobacteraceae bacterium]